MTINKLNQKQILEILLQISEYERKLKERLFSTDYKSKSFSFGLFILTLVFAGVSIISTCIGHFLSNQIIILCSLLFLIISELIFIFYCVINISISFQNIWKFIINPHKELLLTSKILNKSCLKYLKKFDEFSSTDIEFVKRNIQCEKENYEKRCAFLTGPLDKLGFLPIILATTTLILTTISNTQIQLLFSTNASLQMSFYSFTIIVFIFQIFSIIFNLNISHLTKSITILENVLEYKKCEI